MTNSKSSTRPLFLITSLEFNEESTQITGGLASIDGRASKLTAMPMTEQQLKTVSKDLFKDEYYFKLKFELNDVDAVIEGTFMNKPC